MSRAEKDNSSPQKPFENGLDVIIVNHNSTDQLCEALESVYGVMGPKTKVYVEDNASSDRPGRIKERFPKVALCVNSRNLGFAKGVNPALFKGKSPYVMLMNPDTVLKDEGWQDLWEYLEQNPEVGALGPRILDPDGAVQGSARSFHNLMTVLAGRRGPLTRIFPNSRFSRRDVPSLVSDGVTPMEVDWVSGACLVARREAVEQVGGLDERFFMYFEDTDWCRRMALAGWKTIYFPRAKIVHQVGVSSQHRPIRCILEFHKSCYRYMQKYFLKRHPWLAVPSAAMVALRFLGMLTLWSLRRIRGS